VTRHLDLMVMEMQLNGLGTLASDTGRARHGRGHVRENAVNYRSSMQDLARIRAQRVIFSGYLVSTIGVTIVSVWDLVQENSFVGASTIYLNVSPVLAPLTWVALTYSYWWLARLAIEHLDEEILRKVFIGLAAQTLLLTIVSVVYYAFINRDPFSNLFQDSQRWIALSGYLSAIGIALAFVGFYLMLRSFSGARSKLPVDTVRADAYDGD